LTRRASDLKINSVLSKIAVMEVLNIVELYAELLPPPPCVMAVGGGEEIIRKKAEFVLVWKFMLN